MPTLIVEFDQAGQESLTAFLKGVTKRLTGSSARDEIVEILLEHLEPLIEAERATLEPHNKSGALSASLTGRAGSGDDPGTVSVFSAPTATTSMLQETWGLSGRAQQQKWAAKLKASKKRGRTRVFYGVMVNQGHAKPGDKGGEKVVAAIPFATDAAEALGSQQTEAAAAAIVKFVMGGEESSG